MGGALLKAWIGAGLIERAYIVDPADTLPVKSSLIDHHRAFDGWGAAEPPDAILLGIKPQKLGEVLPLLADMKQEAGQAAPLFISIIAGKPIATFEAGLPADSAVLRSMPNTPAAVGRGITALYGGRRVTETHRAMANALFDAAGESVWLDDEGDFDAVTGISGSGPAYVFHLVEALSEAGITAGLKPETAGQLARATVIGAGALLDADAATPAADLRRNVTSPNGTTEAGLEALMGETDASQSLTRLMRETVRRAAARSRELASGN